MTIPAALILVDRLIDTSATTTGGYSLSWPLSWTGRRRAGSNMFVVGILGSWKIGIILVRMRATCVLVSGERSRTGPPALGWDERFVPRLWVYGSRPT